MDSCADWTPPRQLSRQLSRQLFRAFQADGIDLVREQIVGTSVVLITGGLAGIGRAAAIAFAKQGAMVTVAGRREEAGAALVKELRGFGSEAEFIKADVRNENDIRAM